MLTTLVAVTSLIQLAFATTTNNAPEINTTKVYYCSAVDGDCEIDFVIEPFMSMTYYGIKYKNRKLVGCRARFVNGKPVIISANRFCKNPDELHEPITVDGEFRPLITINGQMPGPTIIAREGQNLKITVYNELPNVEGISIHWHGMHQRNNFLMDGVAFITQTPIPTHQSKTYYFTARPKGTHWYHAHSGAHRTDGLYGALIVEDTLPRSLCDEDHPDKHTLLLMDWEKEPSIELFYQIRSSLNFFDSDYNIYNETRARDNTQVAPIPFWSGIINDKGRHYNELGIHNNATLNVFNVTKGRRYRFRLIGAQALYAYKFSIQGHKLTVVASDGDRIDSIDRVHYVIVNSGERYDVVVNANKESGNYWILAETLEVPMGDDGAFNSPVMYHKAEAILHYDEAPHHHEDESFSDISSSWDCTLPIELPCHYVNCPFKTTDDDPNIKCTNVEQFRDPYSENIDEAIYDEKIETLFYNFGFDGETSTRGSSVDGINFRFPSVLPFTNSYKELNQECQGRGCNFEKTDHCACTHVININKVPRGKAVQLVLTNYPNASADPPIESSHPIHLHGHGFYVVKIGYPEYDGSGQYMKSNPDVTCVVNGNESEICERFITVREKDESRVQTVQWANDASLEDLNIRNKALALKDTVIVPFGGYTVIRFLVDNPGWWLLHCHIEIHQLEGMAVVVSELQGKQSTQRHTSHTLHTNRHNNYQ